MPHTPLSKPQQGTFIDYRWDPNFWIKKSMQTDQLKSSKYKKISAKKKNGRRKNAQY
jgi:hypothetical protein